MFVKPSTRTSSLEKATTSVLTLIWPGTRPKGFLPHFTQYHVYKLVPSPEIYDTVASMIDFTGDPLDQTGSRDQSAVMNEA